MKNKPIPWKEFEQLKRDGKLHTEIERIRKHGILLMPNDATVYIKEAEDAIKKDLIKILNKFAENFSLGI